MSDSKMTKICMEGSFKFSVATENGSKFLFCDQKQVLTVCDCR